MISGKICPKCHYKRTLSDDDVYPEYECPNCRIIYNKFIQSNSEKKIPAILNKGNQKQFFFQKHKVLCGIGVIALVLFFTLFYYNAPQTVQSIVETFDTEIPGTYLGEFQKNGNVSTIEFEVDESFCISRLEYTYIPNIIYRKEVKWKFPEYLKAISYNFDTDGKGNQLHTFHAKRQLVREGKTLTIENFNNGKTEGPYTLHSEQLVSDLSCRFILRPTIDKQSLYTHFNLEIPAIGKVSCPSNYSHFFSATEDTFNNNCSSDIKFLIGTGGIFIDSSYVNQGHADNVAVAWKKNTLCRFPCGNSLMPWNVIFRLKNFKGIDPDTLNFRGRSKYIFEAQPEIMLEFTESYLDPIDIWINKDGYGQARIEGKTMHFSIRKKGLLKRDEPLSQLDWRAMYLYFHNLANGRKSVNNVDPRHKNGTYEAVKKQYQKALSTLKEQEKLAGPE